MSSPNNQARAGPAVNDIGLNDPPAPAGPAAPLEDSKEDLNNRDPIVEDLDANNVNNDNPADNLARN